MINDEVKGMLGDQSLIKREAGRIVADNVAQLRSRYELPPYGCSLARDGLVGTQTVDGCSVDRGRRHPATQGIFEIDLPPAEQTVFGSGAGEARQIIHRGGSGPSLCARHHGSGSIPTHGATSGLRLDPIGHIALLEAIGWARERLPTPGDVIETGIKAVDLLCPLADGGLTAFVGGAAQGRMTLLTELHRRLSARSASQALLFLIEPGLASGVPATIAADPAFAPDAMGGLLTLWLVTDHPLRWLTIPVPVFTNILVFSADDARRGLYPALNVAASKRLQVGGWRDAHHRSVADRCRAALAERGSAVAAQLRAYLTQPFAVTAALLDRPGAWVPLDRTLDDCERILDGRLGDRDPESLCMLGGLDG